ncbi:hypothetical protein ACEPAH_2723 [Sanghuangporus vaninii]
MCTSVAYVSLWRVSETIHHDFISKVNGLYESTLPLFDSLVSFSHTMWPYVLPPLFSVLLEAPLSLRTWIAVQKTPSPLPTPTSPRLSRLRKLRKHVFTHIAPVYFLFVSLLASYLHCVARIEPQRMCIFEAVVFGPLFWFASSRLFALLSKMYKLSVRRDTDGDPYVVRTLHPVIPRILQILPISLGLLVTYCTIHFDDAICKAIVHVALLHLFISSDARTRESMRAVGVYALTNIATLLALTIFLAIQSKNIKLLLNPSSSQSPYPAWDEFSSSRLSNSDIIDTIVNNNSSISNSGSAAAYEYDEGVIDDVRGYRWPLFALAVLWNIFPVELITLCYRFDYTRFVKRQGLGFGLGLDSGVDVGVGVGVGVGVSAGETGRQPSLTHDMLLFNPDSVSSREKKSMDVGVGPIYLDPDAPDAFYSRLAVCPPPYSDTDTSDETDPRSTMSTSSSVLPTAPQETGTTTPLPSSLSLHTQTRIPFPAYLTSLTAYIISTLFLSLLFYLSFPSDPSSSCVTPTSLPSALALASSSTTSLLRVSGEEERCWTRRDEALKYLAPLLPLVTLPIMAFAVPLGLIFASANADSEDEAAIKELWRYEETWRAPTAKRAVREVSSGTNE